MSAPDEVVELVERFKRNRESYRSPTYKEAQTRREFIDPLFRALGWDMDNRKGYAEPYKEVIHEASIKVGGGTKAPDYCFRVGTERKFFLEAKKPSVNLKIDPVPAFQLRRYAWSAKLPIGILTDFDEFVVYDCRLEPKREDRASAARVLYLTCDDYITGWDDFEAIFSREAVWRGLFDTFADQSKKKRGTATVDSVFLSEMDAWRLALARSLAANNDLSQRELNYAVQQTIDRIVFLRICEDRGIENYEELKGLIKVRSGVYEALFRLFHRADSRYNSGLFHFSAESDREPPDRLTPGLTIADKVLKDIVKRLYYPDSPYEFSVLPADILGQVYEQFLGKVIHLAASGKVHVEEKPEVKKAGGIVYTPTFIVNYIVRAALAPMLAGKAPADIAGGAKKRPFSVLDPACGSGSFLIAAYQFLLDWHLERYRKDPEHWAKRRPARVFEAGAGDWRLTMAERKRILLTHIFGVDVDVQAVEVTKLSLLLKVLEGETEASVNQQLAMFHERALPDLANNVKAGNSLIGSDFYRTLTLPLSEDDDYKISPFDWREEFPQILAHPKPGFDAVIGNPPYVLLQDEFRDDRQLRYFRANYKVASFKLDTYHLFVERGIALTSEHGRFSMIVPANFLTNNHLDRLRRVLLDQTQIDHIAVIEGGVFPGRSVDNAILAVTCGETSGSPFKVIYTQPAKGKLTGVSGDVIDPDRVRRDEHLLFTGGETDLNAVWEQVWQTAVPLGRIATVNFGKQLRDRRQFSEDVIQVDTLKQIPQNYRPCYTGRDITRFLVKWSGLACLDQEIARRGGCWDADKQNAQNKLLTRQVGRHPEFGIDRRGYQLLNSAFMINLVEPWPNPHFVLGLLNSKLLRAYWLDRYWDRRRTFPKIKGTYLKELPIRDQDPGFGEDRRRHDEIVRTVALLCDLRQEAIDSRLPEGRRRVARQIAAEEAALDRMVFALYGLNEEQVQAVEWQGRSALGHLWEATTSDA